jgi:hypothetical protein
MSKLRARLRSIPVIGAIAMGSIMLLAAAITLCPESILGSNTNDIKLIVFACTFPLYLIGAWTFGLGAWLIGWSRPSEPPEPHGLSPEGVFIFLASLVLNMFVMWAGLKLICSGVPFVRRKLSSPKKDP